MTRIHQSAVPLASSSQKMKVFGEGRVCSYPSCNTQLSRYNPSPLCYRHAVDERPRRRGA